MKKSLFTLVLFVLLVQTLTAQHSIARLWNEKVLDAIRADFARPTIHARNLFHTSVAMYDAWAVYNNEVTPYLLGKTVHGFTCPLLKFPPPGDIKAAQEEAISFAVYRILKHRFKDAPRANSLFYEIDEFMDSLGYNTENISVDYACSGIGMGNYIAQEIIRYGENDGANEAGAYENLFYEPVNPPLDIAKPGNPDVLDINRWQPLYFTQFIDQGGTVIGLGTVDFLGPEWGQVLPFSLENENLNIYQRDGNDYWVYHDPGPPPHLDLTMTGGLSEEYKWGNSLVSIWSSHLDPSDGVMWDISPASSGNIPVSEYPTDILGLRDFYDTFEGGDPGTGYSVNPKTGLPFEPQIVPRGDYARVLAEFWADGPESETPPGHWFTILNYINDHPDMVKKYRGQGEVLDDLEWDVKAYFILGGTMHDVAITSWGIKGWYDYTRPVSAIRAMVELGQSSDPNLASYHPGGIPLVPGYVELIEAGDLLQGNSGQYIGEIKINAWRGPFYIINPNNSVAGVGWIRAKLWYPYQRPSFVTPPFAGYVSGHSTYSRAAAEVLTAMTGDPFFPGGMGEFHCPKNEFLVFEDGPSRDITLQWATYRDASDQCSLSRIWGGIHPPVDDIPGRLIGIEIGEDAINFAEQYFSNTASPVTVEAIKLYPNPASCLINIDFDYEGMVEVALFQSDGKLLSRSELIFLNKQAFLELEKLPFGVYFVIGRDGDGKKLFDEKVIIH